MRQHFLAKLLAVCAIGLSVGSGLAQETREPRRLSQLINVDALIDNYLRFLSRKYNLTEDQDAFTEHFVRSKVDRFLDRHYEEINVAVDRLFDVRTGGTMSQGELMDWGRRVLPVYEEAKDIIIEANDEWRETLTPEQKRIHDEDVKLMYESFATTEDQLGRILAGEMTVEEFRNPRRFTNNRQSTAAARSANAQPGRKPHTVNRVDRTSRTRTSAQPATRTPRSSAQRATPTRGATRSNAARTARSRKAGGQPESKWEQYVRQFIEKYDLTPAQQTKCWKILKDCQRRADKLMRRRQPLLDKLDRQLAEIRDSDSKTKAKELAEINEKKTRVQAEVEEIFSKQLKPRLERIPTRTQREAAGKGGASRAEREVVIQKPQTPENRPEEEPEPEPEEDEPEPEPEPEDEPEE